MKNEEINQKIHQDVMGKCWHKWHSRDGFNFNCEKCSAIQVESTLNTPQNPSYTESIKDAFDVVEKLEKQSFDWSARFLKQYLKPYGFKFDSIKNVTVFSEWADTLPRAICLAALKTLENK